METGEGPWMPSLGAFTPMSQMKRLRFREAKGLNQGGQSEDSVAAWLGSSSDEAARNRGGGKSFPEVGTLGVSWLTSQG